MNPPEQPITVSQIVAYNFKRARIWRGWSQRETADALASHVGTTLGQARISQIELSVTDIQRPWRTKVDDLIAFSRTFGLPIEWFLQPPDELADRPIRTHRGVTAITARELAATFAPPAEIDTAIAAGPQWYRTNPLAAALADGLATLTPNRVVTIVFTGTTTSQLQTARLDVDQGHAAAAAASPAASVASASVS